MVRAFLELEVEVRAEQLLEALVLPHSNGDGGGGCGGAGMNFFITPNMWKTLLSCFQVASTTRPPFLTTRASSAAAASGLPTNITPKVEIDAVERAVGERQLLRVGVLVVDVELLASPLPLGRGRASVGDVGAGHLDARESLRDDPRAPAGAGGEIEDALAGLGCSRSTACSIASAMLRLISS